MVEVVGKGIKIIPKGLGISPKIAIILLIAGIIAIAFIKKSGFLKGKFNGGKVE